MNKCEHCRPVNNIEEVCHNEEAICGLPVTEPICRICKFYKEPEDRYTVLVDRGGDIPFEIVADWVTEKEAWAAITKLNPEAMCYGAWMREDNTKVYDPSPSTGKYYLLKKIDVEIPYAPYLPTFEDESNFMESYRQMYLFGLKSFLAAKKFL